ncbi:LRP chaperone MESD, partial [Fragariocoptes setiger]
MQSHIIITIVLILISTLYLCHHHVGGEKGKPKDLGFMTEMDLEKLYDEWEEHDDEPLPDDELPPHKRPPQPINPVNIDPGKISSNPEQFYKMAKKGKTLMTFVTVAGSPSRTVTEELTGRWQIGLSNAHIKCQRFIVSEDRAIFVFEDGSQAYDAKKFLLDQPELKEYSIENQSFYGKGHTDTESYSKNHDSKVPSTEHSEL